eukprot:c20097_g1_i1 orf=3-167(-)
MKIFTLVEAKATFDLTAEYRQGEERSKIHCAFIKGEIKQVCTRTNRRTCNRQRWH